MVNEWVKVNAESTSGDVIQDYTCENTVGIEKGALLQLLDGRTASGGSILTSISGVACAGVCAREKIADDGRTRVAVLKKGYFEANASGAIVVGDGLMSAGRNQVMTTSAASATQSGAAVIGYAEETASDGEDIIVRLDL